MVKPVIFKQNTKLPSLQNPLSLDPVIECYVYVALLLYTEVETVFMPWLMDETDRSLDRMMMGRILMDCKSYTVHAHIQSSLPLA